MGCSMASAATPLSAAGACVIKSGEAVAERWCQAGPIRSRVTIAGALERFRDRCAA